MFNSGAIFQMWNSLVPLRTGSHNDICPFVLVNYVSQSSGSVQRENEKKKKKKNQRKVVRDKGKEFLKLFFHHCRGENELHQNI